MSISRRAMSALFVGFAIVISLTFFAPTSYLTNRAQKTPQADVASPLLPPARPAMLRKQPVLESYGKLPMIFEANQGQTDSSVKFVSRGSGYNLYLTSTEAVLTLRKARARSEASENQRRKRDLQGTLDPKGLLDKERSRAETASLRMRLIGASTKTRVLGVEQQSARVNYFIGNDPKKWQTNAPTYGRVHYEDVYPGVDLAYYGEQGQLEYDFLIQPGADPHQIRLGFEGAKKIRIDASGDLILTTEGGEVRQHKPIIYQETAGGRESIEGRYSLTGRQNVGFVVAKYDRSRALVIDPVLVYSSYLGGSLDDFGHAIALDEAGNVYVAGETSSVDFPTRNPLQPNHGGNTPGYTNSFVTKINSAGSAMVYSTYLGGSSFDRGYAIAVDRLGSAHITGSTSSTDFPTRNPIQPALASSFNGGLDAFVAKLNPDGSGLVFSTYLGGGGFDVGYGISLDSSSNIYFTGSTGPDWPTTVQAFQPKFNCCHDDAFITKLNPNGTEILYSTYLGGRDAEFGFAIATDASQNAYITGYTESAFDFPTRNAVQPTYGGGISDAFVAKIPTATASFAVPLDSFDSENAGLPSSPYSNFSNWNVTSGNVNLQNNPFGGSSLIVNFDGYPPQGASIETKSPLVLKPTTYRLRFDLSIRNPANSVTVRLGNVFSETFTFDSLGASGLFASVVRDIQVPLQSSAKLSFEYPGGVGSGVWLDNVTLFESVGSGYVTFLGGSGNENRSSLFLGGIKVDNAGNTYLTGSTTSIDFPKAHAIQSALAGGQDAFITKLNPSGSALVYSTFLGGAGDDFGNDLAIDPTGEAFVVGNTTSSNFPVKNAIQPTFGGETQLYGDAFVTKLSATGGEMIYSTYLGGAGRDIAEGVAVDSAGSAYLTGYTTSSTFPLMNSLQAVRGGWEAFFLKIPSVLGTSVPDVFAVAPAIGGNTGHVTVRLTGENINAPPLSVKLRGNGFPDIIGSPISVDGPSTVFSTFNLLGALPGLRDVEITFAGNTVRRMNGAFTVLAGGEPRVWLDIVGPKIVRAGVVQTYHIVYGNSGLIDAFAAPIWIRVPKNWEWGIADPIHPPQFTLPDGESWNNVPMSKPDGEDDIIVITPAWIPAGGTGDISLTVKPKVQSSPQIEAWVTPPLVVVAQKGKSQLQLDCGGRAVKLAYDFVVGLLPTKCLGEIVLFLDDILVSAALDALAESNTRHFLSLNQMLYGAAKVAAKCAVQLVPGLKVLDLVFKSMDIIAGAGEALSLIHDCAELFEPRPFPPVSLGVQVVTSFDPNSKFGSAGSGASQYVTGSEPLRYAIYFENKETATAPAREVVITDQLDPNLVDLSTFSFGPISFGNRRFTPGMGQKNFVTDIDLRPSRSLIARVTGALNSVSGNLTWRFISLDPATGLPTTDPLAGFLPPNVHSPEGDGNVFFTINPKLGLPTGTVITNGSSIIFDTNAPINTPIWSNTLDNSLPASAVRPLTAASCSANLNVQWSGTDNGSGIRDYTIYVSKDGGAFTIWQNNTTATSATYAGQFGHSYAFYSVAQDMTGNVEPAPANPDASVTPSAPAPPTFTSVPAAITVYTGPGAAACRAFVSNGVLGMASAQSSCSAVNITRSGVPVGNLFPVGTTTITYTATDGAGRTVTATQRVTVVDDTAPLINLGHQTITLWPSNHKYNTVTIPDLVAGASDNCDAGVNRNRVVIARVSSDEPDNGGGDGDTSNDIVIAQDCKSVQLRAERDGNRNGRVYVITFMVRDQSGRVGLATAKVAVPKSQNGSPAVDDGPHHTIISACP